jgi:hypothetical protein
VTLSEYQAFMLGILGDEDPEEVQRATAGTMRKLVEEAGDALRTVPREGEWSVLEVLGHMVDGEVASAGRYRWILAQDEPPLPGWQQDDWVRVLRHNEADPALLLDTFEVLKRANVDLWSRTSPADRQRAGIHSERGRETLDLLFRLVAAHDKFHTDQARKTLEEVRAQALPS